MRDIQKIASCTFVKTITHDSDKNVPVAQDTADGVDDVILGSPVVRDEDGAEIFNGISSSDDNFHLLTLE